MVDSSSDNTNDDTTMMDIDDNDNTSLDCYPYTFSPLLLFCQDGYFDKGHSNYNAVVQFFAPVFADNNNNNNANTINMLEHVLYEPTNMLYEDLLQHIETNRCLVICCINAHFTAFQVVAPINNSKQHQASAAAIYYDPLQGTLQYIPPTSFRLFALYHLLKCHYGDSQHVNEHKEHYTGGLAANAVRRQIYKLWDKINVLDQIPYQVQQQAINLNLNDYLLVNNPALPRQMSTQLTSNTCYFQVFLFAVLVKVGGPLQVVTRSGSLDVPKVPALQDVTVRMCRYCLSFFHHSTADTKNVLLRPLTNANVVIDFYRYQSAVYYKLFAKYMQTTTTTTTTTQEEKNGNDAPMIVVDDDYEQQYTALLHYYRTTHKLHAYDKLVLQGPMASALNTKTLQLVYSMDASTAVARLARAENYKYRAANFMLGFNANLTAGLSCFADFQAWRKNQLLRFYNQLCDCDGGFGNVVTMLNADSHTQNKYRDYYFLPQFEIGQPELVDLHHYLYCLDMYQVDHTGNAVAQIIQFVNKRLVQDTYFSTHGWDYDKILSWEDFVASKRQFRVFVNSFLSVQWLQTQVGLGFSEINPKEKEINSLTQTVFYESGFMAQTMNRHSYEFEKECINQMARSTLRKHRKRVEGDITHKLTYKASIIIGEGYTYSKYNTLMHFLNTVTSYWNNPDLSNIQVFGKDIRTLLAVSSQKLFFDEGRHCGYYHYGPIETHDVFGQSALDLVVGSETNLITPSVARKKRKGRTNDLILVDRVYEYNFLKEILKETFYQAHGERFKSDNEVLNLCLLSLMLDFGLYEKYFGLLRLPFLHLQHQADTCELQVEIANLIYERDRKSATDSVTRAQVVELLFETSTRFLVNKGMDARSKQAKLIRLLNADPDYQSYVLYVKIYLSLCQLNRSSEVDYYKIHVHGHDEAGAPTHHSEGEFKIIIPQNYSKATSSYLEEVTKRYTFSEAGGIMSYDEQPVFDLRPQQPEINLFRARFYSASEIQSMVKYIEMANLFRVQGDQEEYLAFIANNVLRIDVAPDGAIKLRISRIEVEMATVFFNEAISFIPCFKYADSDDIVLFTSLYMSYMVDKGGQFSTEYYGMVHELLECIGSDEVFIDMNDEHVFKEYRLCELLGESKTVVYAPAHLLQVSTRQQLIDLLDLAVKIRNVSFFILVLFYLRRTSANLSFYAKDGKMVKITGPWLSAIQYVLSSASRNAHYDAVFGRQFVDLDQHKHLPLDDFIVTVCDNFAKYQGVAPWPKQRAFLRRLITAPAPFHFSEVGSGKTKVILPLLCQIFLSNNSEAHRYLARGGQTAKTVLIVLVPEHLVNDARAQVYQHCLNLNFRADYRVYDDIFALLHKSVQLGTQQKQIFVTSFNSFKKALTADVICAKVRPNRGKILVVADEVDDFLERNKLVFNICSNKASSFDRPTLDLYFETCRAAYQALPALSLEASSSSDNPPYWQTLYHKFRAIHTEIQDASRSINKSFGIFNAHTLRHCETNIVHDVEGYKSLIARPYESVNRAMPGSYYSDVERTIFLTYVILAEDVGKYNELFQSERKFITFEYWKTNFIHQLDFDDLVYGHESLAEIVEKHPETRQGLARFLFVSIMRKMEIRDKSRSVNSVDVMFNFDVIGFTGTPFLDNYPTFEYITGGRRDDIPDLIDRSFYAYSSEELTSAMFVERFATFQGQNSNVAVRYVDSDFLRDLPSEAAILTALFEKEQSHTDSSSSSSQLTPNVLVDLCGIFKQSDVFDVGGIIRQHFGPDKFHYVYHIDQTDGSDRVLCLDSENDTPYDAEFFKFMHNRYGADWRDAVFFFIDNRNVIGKDVPFQLGYRHQFGKPLFGRSVVIAHDVDDFSKIWQAMGRSRTMNDTAFSIYKSGLSATSVGEGSSLTQDIKKHAITRDLYVRNCDCKIAGNISSIYLTLIALYNLAHESFYYCDEIVNTFLDKMEDTLKGKVAMHEQQLVDSILASPVAAQILLHMLVDKFRKSAVQAVSNESMDHLKVEALMRHIVQQRYEERVPSGDIYDTLVLYLSGEQQSLMEVSYTKQQQKQKQMQKSKDQDSDTIAVFDPKNRLFVDLEMENYYESSRLMNEPTKAVLHLASFVPILSMSYETQGTVNEIKIYPTLQFLYSHHVQGPYITDAVRKSFLPFVGNPLKQCDKFLASLGRSTGKSPPTSGSTTGLNVKVLSNFVRQNPLFTIAALSKGVYIIGMKDQFNVFDRRFSPLRDEVQYIFDEMGFILYDRTNRKSVDEFGPYFIEQYILLDVLSRQEVAQNVLEYYENNKSTLVHGLQTYQEKQGKGFICWRFLMNEAAKRSAAPETAETAKRPSASNRDEQTDDNKRARSQDEELNKMDEAEASDDVADGLARVKMVH